MAMIEVRNLGKSFKDGDTENLLFKNLSLSVDLGEFVAFTGESGCGKTTLLNMIGGLDDPDQGEILVDGIAISGLNSAKRAHFLNQNVGFIFQTHYLLPEQTALANVMLPMRIAGRSKSDALPRATELLEKLRLGHRLHAYSTTMSGGECQRVAIARALANKPKVLLADEPTASLNVEFKQQVIEDLLQLSRSEHATVVMVTHDVGLIEPQPGNLLIDRRIDIGQFKVDARH
ncbi:MAG TPA: ABC transporter ATP-binding protein [Bradyrhizobium sp.]|nr:ABC transporter ATP-binding protein [Bradyrhizobium sp.]